MDILKFKERLIAFDFDSDLVNATDMLKAFPGKRINNFLRTNETIEFIKVLEQSARISATVIKQGGSDQGTWMHKLLAYKFAAWLSPEFELFVYRVFDQALKIAIAEREEKISRQQRELDYFWDREDLKDIYKNKKQ